MAENSVILSVEEEAKLLQPIDEYVGKIQDQIDALRVDGTDQVNNISNCIAIAKENKNLSKEEQAKLIAEYKKELEKANLEVLAKFDGYTENDVQANTERIVYVIKKKQ